MYNDNLIPAEDEICKMQSAFETDRMREGGEKHAHSLTMLYRFLASRAISKKRRQLFCEIADGLEECYALPRGYGMRQAREMFPNKKMPTSLRMGIRFAIWLEAEFAQKVIITNVVGAMERLQVIAFLAN